jgi:Ca2+-binding EF-hand superfamily protein
MRADAQERANAVWYAGHQRLDALRRCAFWAHPHPPRTLLQQTVQRDGCPSRCAHGAVLCPRCAVAIDKDGSGTIEIDELRLALQRFDMKLTEIQLDKILSLLDKDQDQEISYEELAAAFVRAGEKEEPAGSYEAAMANAIMKRGSEASHRSLNDSQEIAQQQSEEERAEKRREAEQASVIEVMLNAVKGKRTLFGQKLENPRALFDAMDKDGSNSISVDEFRQAIDRLGLGLSQEHTEAVVRTLDADGNGEIVYEEFVDRLWRHVEARLQEQEAETELSALQEQERDFAAKQKREEEIKAAPTEEQAQKRDKALVENRMEVLRNTVSSGRQLYGVKIKSVAALFCTIDKDGSGSIDTSELREALEVLMGANHRMGLQLSSEQLDLIIASIDSDQDLEVTYWELLAAIKPKEKETQQTLDEARAAADARRAKEQRDKDKKKQGTLSQAEKDKHERARAENRTQAARDNVMRVLRLATKPIPPSALMPKGGHRKLYGKKLTDTMSVFEAIDRDNSGSITLDELMKALQRLGAEVPEAQLREMVDAFDDDQNGELDYQEFFMAAEMERASAATRPKKKKDSGLGDNTPPTSAGGAASAAGGATRRRRAGGGWHVSSRPTIWSKLLRANPSKIGRSVKSSQNQMGSLGAVGTMVSGHTNAPCWSLAAASYISPAYDPSPPKNVCFGVSDGDPVMWWPPLKPGLASPAFGTVQKVSMVDANGKGVPLGQSPRVQVLLPNFTSVIFTEEGEIGVEWRQNDVTGNVEVSSITPGTQAQTKHSARLRPGMVLLAVGTTKVAGMAYEQVIELIDAAAKARPLTFQFGADGKRSDGLTLKEASAGSTVRTRRRISALNAAPPPLDEVFLKTKTTGTTKKRKKTRKEKRDAALERGRRRISAGIRKKPQGSTGKDRSWSTLARMRELAKKSVERDLKVVTVRISPVKELVMEVTRDMLVLELKEQIEQTTGQTQGAMWDQRLIFAGKSLDDELSLGECNVLNEAMIRVQKPSKWSSHLKGYGYSTLQHWDKSTVQARRRVKQPQAAAPAHTPGADDTETADADLNTPAQEEAQIQADSTQGRLKRQQQWRASLRAGSVVTHRHSDGTATTKAVSRTQLGAHGRPALAWLQTATAVVEDQGTAIDELHEPDAKDAQRFTNAALATAAVNAHKVSLARILQRKVHAELTKRHVSARTAFPAFVSRADNLATVEDLHRGFTELGVRMPIEANGQRPELARVITDVLKEMSGVVQLGDGVLAVDEHTFQLWIAPEPSEVATVYTEKILAERPPAGNERAEGSAAGGGSGPTVSKAVERAQRTVDVITDQLQDIQREISDAEKKHSEALALEAVHAEKRAVANGGKRIERMELEFENSQRMRAERAAELEEALASRQAAVQARKDAEAARHKGARLCARSNACSCKRIASAKKDITHRSIVGQPFHSWLYSAS